MRATRIRRDTSQVGSAIVILGFGTGHHLFGDFVGVPADRLFEPVGHFRVFLEEDLGILATRSEEHTSELQSLMRISYAVFCLKKTKKRSHQCQQNDSTVVIQNIHTYIKSRSKPTAEE